MSNACCLWLSRFDLPRSRARSPLGIPGNLVKIAGNTKELILVTDAGLRTRVKGRFAQSKNNFSKSMKNSFFFALDFIMNEKACYP